MRIVFMGNNNRGVECLKVIIDNGYDVAGVVAHPDPTEQVPYRSVGDFARKHGIDVIAPERVGRATAKIADWKPDLIVLSGYNQILKKALIDVAPLGCINCHGGRLPDYRGTAPLNWQIINGEDQLGLSILYVETGIDTGDIILEDTFSLRSNETIADALATSIKRFPSMLLEVLKMVESGSVSRNPQNPLEGCYYTRRYPRDGVLHLHAMSARRVHNMVRALTHPCPGAFTTIRGRRLFFWKTRLMDMKVIGPPGRIVWRTGEGLVVTCADRGLLVGRAQLEDGPELPARQLKLPLGTDLGT